MWAAWANTLRYLLSGILFALACASAVGSVEITCLTAANWDEFAPRGKEVDSIYGDIVLRNRRIIAVIARPGPTRHANLTVHDVGGCLLDLTFRDFPNDQLSAYYPGAREVVFDQAQFQVDGGEWRPLSDLATSVVSGSRIDLRMVGKPRGVGPRQTVVYRLVEDAGFVEIESSFHGAVAPSAPRRLDAMRADRDFQMQTSLGGRLFWAADYWWGQAYGVVCDELEIRPDPTTVQNLRPVLEFVPAENNDSLSPDSTWRRKVYPASNSLDVQAIGARLLGRQVREMILRVRDPDRPVKNAKVLVKRDDQALGSGRTNGEGRLRVALEPGFYLAVVSAIGHGERAIPLDLRGGDLKEQVVELEAAGYVVAEITDDKGEPIACKVEFRGIEPAADPYFGPDTYVWEVQNLIYTEDGRFRRALEPGRYRVTISHGPEYDAVTKPLVITRGKAAPLSAQLRRTVDTSGWISADFHSHSSPSGDNTSSQLGRVLNLLAEHIEFAPCTEHNRISTYEPHLRRLDAVGRMATCSGIELTGAVLPVNHQNAFPLEYHPHTQDGGAPQIDENPVVQIERLALWDNGRDKLVQENHPDIIRILADGDLDGKADGGFEKMFRWMDVIEVHPPHLILSPPERPTPENPFGNVMLHWMQLFNLGYRIPGVVNTDAHYTFHGSGWLRNYIVCSTDDPAKIDVMEVVQASEAGHIVLTNGPFLEVQYQTEAASAIPGDDVQSSGAGQLLVRVQCANWLEVNRVQVLINGRAEPALNFHRRTHSTMFGPGVVQFDATLPIRLERDAHLIVAAIGEGLNLSAVMGPQQAAVPPVAVSNPIFVDVDGGGFQPNGDLLGVPIPGFDPKKAGPGQANSGR